MNFAVIDFKSGNAGEALVESLHETGFAVLTMHPIPEALIQEIYEEWLVFFDSEAKKRYPFTPEGQDGYFAAPESGARTDYDNKEFFHLYPWGQIPTEVSDNAIRYRAHAMRLGKTLLDWLDRASPETVRLQFSMPLARMLEGGERNTLLRILRYPPVRHADAATTLRAGVHQDTNLLTLLPAATGPGLEAQDRNAAWHELPAKPGYLTVNAGVMLELISGGYYPATTHRVANPGGDAGKRSRLSMPLFLHPADEVILYDNVTAAAFLAGRARARAQAAQGIHST